MIADDFTFAEGPEGLYLVKKTKTGNFSKDRRLLTDGEAYYIFEHFLKKHVEKTGKNELIVAKGGKNIYKASFITDEKKEETETLL